MIRSANISAPTHKPIKNPRSNSFPAWRLTNDVMKASDAALKDAGESCERWGGGSAALVVIGVLAEVAIAAYHPQYDSFLEQWGSTLANVLVAIGVAAEVQFGRMGRRRDAELQRRSNDKLGAAEKIAAEASERAERADLSRVELETKLLPRMLSQEQWDFIQGLRGKFPIIAIAFETDAETRWFASHIRDAFFSAKIPVAMYARAPEVHSVSTFLYEPKGFDVARPKTVGPLAEIFGMMDLIGSLAIITEVPTDILLSITENTRPEMRAPLDTPMIILGGKFVVPPPHLEKLAKAAKAARDSMNKKP